MRQSKLLPYLALVIGMVTMAFSPFFVRWAEAPGPVTAFYRVGIATLVLLPFFIRSLKRDHINLRQVSWLYPALGGLSLSADLICWTLALFYTRAATATLLGNTAPLWVALIAWLVFRERLKPIFWLGLTFALSGAVAVVGGDLVLGEGVQVSIGNLLGLGSGLFYGGYFLAAQLGRERASTIRYFWPLNLACTIVLWIFDAANGWSFTGYPAQTYLAFLGAGLVTQVIGYYAVIYALGHLPASVVSPTLIGQPVLVALLGIPILGEYLATHQWLGGLVVLLGIYIVHRSREGGGEDAESREERTRRRGEGETRGTGTVSSEL